VKAPETIETARLLLHRPRAHDLDEVLSRYASDPEVTRFVGWPRHKSIADTEAFFEFSEAAWNQWPAGPFLVRSRADGSLLGSTGLAFDSGHEASTGYVFAKDEWRKGFASESLRTMVDLARSLGIKRLYAICHIEHQSSVRVLEKCGFHCEGVLPKHIRFPNLPEPAASDVFCYAAIFQVP
jgi:ribosomal-protein-alanine N-acetyltransferase